MASKNSLKLVEQDNLNNYDGVRNPHRMVQQDRPALCASRNKI